MLRRLWYLSGECPQLVEPGLYIYMLQPFYYEITD